MSIRTINFVVDSLMAGSEENDELPDSGYKTENRLVNIHREVIATSPLYTVGAPIKYDAVKIDFPIDFINKQGNKFITVKNAKHVSYTGENLKLVLICSDILQSDKYADSFVCFCNENYYDKKIQIYDTRAHFFLWLKNEHNEILDLDTSLRRVFVELLLEF
jgi:hypothetical protein